MKRLVPLFGLFLLRTALADPTVLAARDLGWEVRFDAPPTAKVEERSTPNAYRYAGTAGKFNLSLFIEPPQCEGGATNNEQLQCFAGRLEKVPGLVRQSIRVNRLPNAVQLSYLTYGQTGETAVKIMHTHVLFADKGKWGDLHGSIVKPDTAEIAMLLALGDNFSFTD
ncbi:hypothetical protein IP92_01519 [Pseudoduganella flava]|uniref:DUF1795 domain-containing protein n=1 Tax=Pseudoduganella flava TaxID=871742 RepID=A0A562Q1G4_9BURK|nr:hypothetical protein [Pseudoduganella flava]QGZ38185.1 hypothetical protein GO485_03390 [Pseudoduganella flava]TWI50290.1 hypothetical protein IP92_01519 [Pseudoduganella flava]